MKLVMTLLVKNEADIIRQNIKFHLDCGVDHIIVADNESTDGTWDLLKECERDGQLTVTRQDGDDYRQDEWVTRMALNARDSFGADWIINCDADEFWVAKGYNLKDAILATNGNVLLIERQNMLPPLRGGVGDATLSMTEAVVRPKEGAFSIMTRIGQKAFVEAKSLVHVGFGNHDVKLCAEKRIDVAPIVGIHYPVRGYKHFELKVAQGGSAIERNSAVPQSTGNHWRGWYKLYQEGRLREAYESYIPSQPERRALRRAGHLATDLRVANLMKQQLGLPR